MENTIVFYSTKNDKDTLCIESMFKDYDMQEIYTLTPKVSSEYTQVYTWTKKEEIEESYIYNLNRRLVEERLKDGGYTQVIIYGTDIIMLDVIEYIIGINKERASKKEKGKLKIKIISEIYEGTLFYDRERKSFLKCIEFLKKKEIYKLYFLKKGIYEAYLNMGYNVRIFTAKLCS